MYVYYWYIGNTVSLSGGFQLNAWFSQKYGEWVRNILTDKVDNSN